MTAPTRRRDRRDSPPLQRPESPRARRPGAPLVAIVDADRRVRSSLPDLLRLGGVCVAGAAAGASDALALIERWQPDLVLIDPSLPKPGAGRELIATIRARWPDLGLLVMGWPNRADRTQAPGHLSKDAPPADFLRAIMAALPGSD